MINKCKFCQIEIEKPKRNNCGSEKCIQLMTKEHNISYKNENPNKFITPEWRRKYQRTHKIEISVRRLTRKTNRRDNICILCGEMKDTQFHHCSYQPNIFFELCSNCHKLIHKSNFKLRFCRDLSKFKKVKIKVKK